MKKILVIEDQAQTRNLFLECLEAEGFYTIGAENGLIGVQQAQEHLPDLVICDIIMPLLNGYDVLTTLRQDTDTAMIPFIFVTAKGTRTDLRKGMELGADDYLTKPCTLEELLRAITVCLEKRATLSKWYVAQSQPVPETPEAEIKKVATPESFFPSNPQLSEVFHFIEDNYSQPITLSDVAVAVGYSPAYLTHLVRLQTGKTLQTWIIQRRMAAARCLLLGTSETVEEIATKLGYRHTVHFCRQFRQHHETTPITWRKMQLLSSDKSEMIVQSI